MPRQPSCDLGVLEEHHSGPLDDQLVPAVWTPNDPLDSASHDSCQLGDIVMMAHDVVLGEGLH